MRFILKQESWRVDPSGFFSQSPHLDNFRDRFFCAMSLSQAGNMQEENVRANFMRRLDLEANKLAVSYQTHSTLIHSLKRMEDCPTTRVSGVDGWIAASVGGVSLGVFSADCMPVILIHREKSLGVLLHAGWKGLLKGIIEEALRMLCENFCGEFSVKTKDFVAAIGPHIGACCYEVRDDVARQFPKEWIEERGGKLYLDLGKGVASKLANFGLKDIALSTDCTKCKKDFYFSYRRKDKATMLTTLHFLQGQH